MNQQVYKFALQAGFSSWELNPSKETMSDTPEKIKKLAELIVRECAGVSENHKGMNDKYFIADAIKKHFGVEE